VAGPVPSHSMDLEAAKQAVCERVDQHASQLVAVSHQLHAHPELAWEEHAAHDLLTGVLDEHQLAVERHAYGLDTAFAARAGDSGPAVAVVCEYDALPGVGHACGHNIIGAAGLGAALATAPLAEHLGGRLVVLGTPAEEGGGGKITMMQRGALDGVEAALMVHPANVERRAMATLAVQQLWVDYHGRAAHAAAAPHEGRNALDAAVLGYLNVATLRQHLPTDERVHGVFTHGGDQPNVVPARAQTHWYVRAPDLGALDVLRERVLAALLAGAEAVGCRAEHRWHDIVYADLWSNPTIEDLWVDNVTRLGRRPQPADALPTVIASTDMGNISQQVPSIHPMLEVAPADTPIHTAAFADHAAAPEGDRAVLDGAKAMAMTVVDLWARPEALAAAGAELAGSGTTATPGPDRRD